MKVLFSNKRQVLLFFVNLSPFLVILIVEVIRYFVLAYDAKLNGIHNFDYFTYINHSQFVIMYDLITNLVLFCVGIAIAVLIGIFSDNIRQLIFLTIIRTAIRALLLFAFLQNNSTGISDLDNLISGILIVFYVFSILVVNIPIIAIKATNSQSKNKRKEVEQNKKDIEN